MGIPTLVKRHILRHDETWEESVIGRTLGLDCFDQIAEEYTPGKGWTATTLRGPDGSPSSITWGTTGKENGCSLLEFIPNPPAEVDKGERTQCWVSGCRVEADLKRCKSAGVLLGRALLTVSSFRHWLWKGTLLLTATPEVCLAKAQEIMQVVIAICGSLCPFLVLVSDTIA